MLSKKYSKSPITLKGVIHIMMNEYKKFNKHHLSTAEILFNFFGKDT